MACGIEISEQNSIALNRAVGGKVLTVIDSHNALNIKYFPDEFGLFGIFCG